MDFFLQSAFLDYILLLVPSLKSADGVKNEKKQKRTADATKGNHTTKSIYN